MKGGAAGLRQRSGTREPIWPFAPERVLQRVQTIMALACRIGDRIMEMGRKGEV